MNSPPRQTQAQSHSSLHYPPWRHAIFVEGGEIQFKALNEEQAVEALRRAEKALERTEFYNREVVRLDSEESEDAPSLGKVWADVLAKRREGAALAIAAAKAAQADVAKNPDKFVSLSTMANIIAYADYTYAQIEYEMRTGKMTHEDLDDYFDE